MKTKHLFAILLFFICAGFTAKVYATHIAGGELIYSWVSDSTYHITFKLYRDCSSSAATPANVPLCYKSSCTSNSSTLTLPKSATINNGAANGAVVSVGCAGYPNTCSQMNSAIPGYREYWYEGNITLPRRCAKWTFSVTIMNRNANDNLLNANMTSFYVEATLNNLLAQGNSSAQFTVKPVPYVCDNQTYSYNNGAYDANNDSLGYKIIQPESQTGCGAAPNPIPFLSTAYNLSNNPLATNNTFVLDTITGQLNFTPSQLGAYTLALRVTEYRNHVAIGTTMRDIQVQVIGCSINAPVVKPDTGTIQLVNSEIHDCGGFPLHFCFNASSTNSAAVLLPTDNHAIVAPGSTLTYTGAFTSAIYGCFTWSPTTADTGVRVLTVTVTDSSCAPPGITEANTFTLPLYIFPVSHSNTDTVVCLGKRINLTAHGISPFTWLALPGGSPLGTLSCTNCQYPTDSITTATVTTTYVAASTLPNGCPSLDTVVVVPWALPAVPVVSGTTPMCLHDTLKLYASDTASSYVWTGPAGFASAQKNPTLQDFQQVDTGLYYAVAKNAYCGSAADSVNISIFPTTYSLNADTTICQGSSVQLYSKGSTFIWSVLPGGSKDSTLTCLGCADPVATPGVTTSYVVSSNQVVCNTADTVTITVIDFPAKPMPYSNTPVCYNAPIKLFSGTGAFSYTWTGPNGFTDTVQNPIIANAQLANTGEYHVTAANWHCITMPDSTHVTIVPIPLKPGIVTNSPLCAGSPFIVSAQDTQLVNYYWKGPNGFFNYAPDFTILNVTTQYAGLYTLHTAFPSDTACTSPVDSYLVIIKPKVNASFQFVTDSVCQGYPLLINYIVNGADSLVWNFSSGVAESLSANPLDVVFTKPGKQVVTLDAFNGVCADTATHNIYVLLTSPASFTATQVSCPGTQVTVNTNHTYGRDVSFTWNFEPATVVRGAGAGPYTLLYYPPGSYIISLVTQNEYCTSYPFYDTIVAQPYPDVRITTSDISNICSWDSVYFEGAGVPGYHYQWQQAIYFNNDTALSTYALIRNTGYIYLYVTDRFGCKASDSVFITPHPCCNVYLPNSFTPNGDGKNDIFRPITIGHHDIAYFGIFNRWGQEIYTSINEQDGWNGAIKGIPADAGTYFYSIKYKCVTGEYFTNKGEVVLIR